RGSHSGSFRIHSYTLIMTLAALLLPLTQARHLHDQLALGFAYDDADSSSGSASLSLNSGDSESESDSNSSESSDSLPAWHVNPFHGLADSFGDASYDSDASSSSSVEAETDSSYEKIAQAAVYATLHELRRQRIRHRRSHTLRFFARVQEAAAPEWVNPCGGVYQPDQSQPREADVSSAAKRKHLIALRNNTRIEYWNIRQDANLDYGDIQAWQREYKFLPNMTRPTDVVKLKTWYRHVQTFVGSFAYLGKAQYKYHKDHQLPLGQSTEELHKLLVSARSVLCEIETTINASYPYSNVAKLSQISRAAMLDRLKFYTPADGSKEADKRDLKFTKQLYYQFLDNMWKSLRLALRKHHRGSMERRQHAASASASAISSVANSRQTFSLESSESAAGLASVVAAASNDSGCLNSAEC
ncbi:uncharacterized protein LOC115768707, partial [Drosophila novamexicana]|uniref:uncharacterized protein LOC115768707 n=1 Tax=Drosophila novamexicana TaxID=47314 RepID=UPI0011E5934D